MSSSFVAGDERRGMKKRNIELQNYIPIYKWNLKARDATPNVYNIHIYIIHKAAAGYLSRAWRKGREYRSASDLPHDARRRRYIYLPTVVATNLQILDLHRSNKIYFYVYSRALMQLYISLFMHTYYIYTIKYKVPFENYLNSVNCFYF